MKLTDFYHPRHGQRYCQGKILGLQWQNMEATFKVKILEGNQYPAIDGLMYCIRVGPNIYSHTYSLFKLMMYHCQNLMCLLLKPCRWLWGKWRETLPDTTKSYAKKQFMRIIPKPPVPDASKLTKAPTVSLHLCVFIKPCEPW